jgi:hypothetical protein
MSLQPIVESRSLWAWAWHLLGWHLWWSRSSNDNWMPQVQGKPEETCNKMKYIEGSQWSEKSAQCLYVFRCGGWWVTNSIFSTSRKYLALVATSHCWMADNCTQILKRLQ